ncbi:fimbrial protein [Burkholderia sp. ABCPW 11]|nr:fimbrial protein [Burkholderia sp. ABCPW 11]
MSSNRPLRIGTARLPRMKLIPLLVTGCVATWVGDGRAQPAASAQAATSQPERVEFDDAFLANRVGKNFDITRFEQRNITAPGVYGVDIRVGNDWIGRHDVRFAAVADTADAQPCFDRALLERAGVDLTRLAPDAVARLDASEACHRIGDIVADASATFDFTRQTLTLGIPQAALVRRARGYVSPDQWTSGVPVGLLGYNLNVYTSKSSGEAARTQGYLGLSGGVNVGDWHLRHEGSYSWSSSGERQYQDIATYLQRDLTALSSQLVIGESYTSGELFDSTRFRGVRVSTDDRMLPDSLRGYAPVVRGVANSNAKVTIRQNGVLLYETTVAPGNFEIDDLYPTGYGGDLDVSVNEADGTVHTFSVPYAAVPLSLRPGISRYSFVAGALRSTGGGQPLFTQATYQRGLTNLLTGYGGVTLAGGYAAFMIGGALNTSFGAIGMDVTHATTSIPGARRFNGSSMRVSYAKSVAQTGTDIALAAYRYSTDGYFGLNDAMQARDAARNGLSSSASVWRQRHRASLTLTQRLGEKGGRVDLTASAADYWNRSGSDVNYTVGYTNSFRNVSYNLSATRQRNIGGDMSTLYYASVTIPLGRARPTTLTGNLSYDTRGRTRMQSTLSGSTGMDNALSYSVSANHASGSGMSTTDGSGNVAYRSRVAEFSASAGASADYQQGSLGMRGAIVAHGGGITFSQPVSETFAIVEAPGAAGARITNASGARVDGSGYAIVPYLTPYSLNTVALDPKGISMDVDLKETSRQIAPRAGAVPLIRFATDNGRAALVHARQADGAPLPFGAAVYDETGKEIGVVGQASRIFVRGLKHEGELTVQWGTDDGSACRITYELPTVNKHQRKSSGLQSIDGVCAAAPTLAGGE